MSTHLTRRFSVDEANDAVFDQAERVMGSLMDLEEDDPTITDSDVSVDAEHRQVTVEVYTEDDTRSDDDLLGRIGLALKDAGVGVREVKRELEFA